MEGHELELVLLGVLLASAGLLLAAQRSSVPYPIMFVVGGAALGFFPGLPEVELDPDLVLIIFLPPLLYSAAFFSSLATCAPTCGRSRCWPSGWSSPRRSPWPWWPTPSSTGCRGRRRSCWAPCCRPPIRSRRPPSPRASALRGAT